MQNRARLWATLTLAALSVGALAKSPEGRIVDVGVVGSDFRITLSDGRVLTGTDLVGATLSMVGPGSSAPQQIRIDAVQIDPLDTDHEMRVFRMMAIDPASGVAEELCGPDVRGERWAFPVPGHWDSEGRRISRQGFTVTCADGAQGKCVRFGYKPWKTLENGTKLEDYHQACIHLVRANYCGDHGTTRDGMLIDIYDRIGIQQPEPDPGHYNLRFEAAWDVNGAVCVAHTRVAPNATLPSLAAACPRLADRLGEATCTEQTAARWSTSVLLYNRSR